LSLFIRGERKSNLLADYSEIDHNCIWIFWYKWKFCENLYSYENTILL